MLSGNRPSSSGNHLSFSDRVRQSGFSLSKSSIEILQVNVGKLCNMTCTHCHVEAGPYRTENMDERTAVAVLKFLEESGIPKFDLTGGAPEMTPHFELLVTEARRMGRHVMDRCNLTVFFEEGRGGLPEFLAKNRVEVIASLPCYTKENVDKQRGKGAFHGSIEGLLRLNRLGYGKEGSDLLLNLVYNPVGAHLPPSQESLEIDYKKRLREDFGIVFDRLYTITNMPMTRYAKYLKTLGQFDSYMELLVQNFNATTLSSVMCRDTLSVGWDGKLYDCDFNQMLDMQISNGKPLTIFDVRSDQLKGMKILTGNHCFGCTAGCGSSCSGAIVQ